MRPIVLKGHERPLTQVKFNRDGDLVFACSKDSVASIWYSINGERLGTLDDHSGTIWSIDVDENTTYCLTGGADFCFKIWEIATGVAVHSVSTRSPVIRVEFSPDGTKLLIVLDAVMGHVGSIVVYSLIRNENGEIVKVNEEPEYEINTIEEATKVFVASWSYNGKYIVAGHDDGQISTYNGESGEFIQVKKIHEKSIKDIQFSPDRTYFITSSRDSAACLIDVNTLDVLKTYKADCPLNSACITPLKEFVILGGGQDAKDVTTTSAREGKFEARIYHKVFEDEIGRVKGHFGPLNYVAVSPTGTSYASGGEDGYIRLHHFDKSYFDFKYDVEKTFEVERRKQLQKQE
ncbi:translation initiation factor eIF3 subunit [Kluyveromyces marxianus]|nr:translation initiation factor eIF3 subunit [Kluyveromyces marxianus]KAG0678023.1 translation initiation factor eIF3 subunit [Kluyveromyces marxianus]